MPIKFYPEDDQDVGSVGIKFPTNGTGQANSGFFNLSRTTEEQAVTNYINLLLTFPGERYFQPNYGIGLQRKIFEPNTQGLRSEIEFTIREQSAIWLPYIRNHSIDVLESVEGDENSIQVKITFSVSEAKANKTITLFQNQGRVSYTVE